MGVKIGNTVLKYGLALAPMAGVTDRSFRSVCRKLGAEYTVTEMISAKGMHYGDRKTDELAAPAEGEAPYAIQIFGREPEIMAESAAKLVKRYSPAVIDINMGCPVKKIFSNGEGSALMKEPERAFEIVRAVKAAVGIPVTVKFRSGVDDAHKNAPEFAQMMEKAGADALCIHGRTREQLYRPPVDFDVIRGVCSAVGIPVFANGGIDSPEAAAEMLEKTGCGGLMIARGACGNPWIFSAIAAMLDGKAYSAPGLAERIGTALEQTRAMIADKGEKQGIREARHHLAFYLHGVRGGASARDRINHAETYEEIEKIVLPLLASEPGSGE